MTGAKIKPDPKFMIIERIISRNNTHSEIRDTYICGIQYLKNRLDTIMGLTAEYNLEIDLTIKHIKSGDAEEMRKKLESWILSRINRGVF